MKLVAIFAVGLLAGASIMYVVPFLLPKTTVQDRLREMDLSFTQKDWYASSLQYAKYVDQYKFLESMKNAYDEKLSQKAAQDSLHIYQDTSWDIVWLELWLNNEPANLEYLGFYIYNEAD